MSLVVYNTITRKKEVFESIEKGKVGMYVCGPTVYGYPHLGHAKSYVTFDVIYRYLMYIGYKVKYVQNITDVGHLLGDSDSGEDKIAKQAKAEMIDPYEVAYKYESIYFDCMRKLNVKRPSISARATGHIIEIIDMIEKLINKGYAYVTKDGNVYYRVSKFKKYGSLSKRTVDEAVSGKRIEASSDKENPEDFALWKRAEDNHLMKWPSPWGDGYPGWHIECSVMSKKYLGSFFDIHGGGMDNIFPHHECEVAQSEIANDSPFVKYFIHNNLITVSGQKMGKSLGNFMTLPDLFKDYDPMVVRLYILLNHYRRPTDFSTDGLNEAKKMYEKITTSVSLLRKEVEKLEFTTMELVPEVQELKEKFLAAMDDDFNTGLSISYLYEAQKLINKTITGDKKPSMLLALDNFIKDCGEEILGLNFKNNNDSKEEELIEIINDIRKKYREEKNYKEADILRDKLKNIGISVSDR